MLRHIIRLPRSDVIPNTIIIGVFWRGIILSCLGPIGRVSEYVGLNNGPRVSLITDVIELREGLPICENISTLSQSAGVERVVAMA